MAVHKLEILYGILDINQTAGAILHVHLIWFDPFPNLLPTEVQGGGEVPGVSTVDKRVARLFAAPSENRISCHGSELVVCLPL